MATIGTWIGATASQATARPQTREYAKSSIRFDLIVALLSTWFMVGLFIDGWAHNNGQVDNTFFTPWHGILYSGVAATGLFLAVTQMRNVGRGYDWGYALPKGYLLSLIGIVVFLLGGGFDFAWHEMFGFEADRAALLSPAHLLLSSAGFLILTGPVRAALARSRVDQIQGWLGFFPMVLALTLVLALLLFFTSFTHLETTAWWALTGTAGNDEYFLDVVGITSAVLPAALSVGVLLYVIRRWGKQLPFGTLTFILTVSSALMFWLSLPLNPLPLPERVVTLLAPLAAGLLGDALLHLLDARRGGWRLGALAFAVPFVYVLLFFVILNNLDGMWWAIHLSLGTAFYAGFAGLFLSLVQLAPSEPA
jgi:hypothetical protein